VIEEFLSVLREIGSVSAAAKQLGLNCSFSPFGGS